MSTDRSRSAFIHTPCSRLILRARHVRQGTLSASISRSNKFSFGKAPATPGPTPAATTAGRALHTMVGRLGQGHRLAWQKLSEYGPLVVVVFRQVELALFRFLTTSRKSASTWRTRPPPAARYRAITHHVCASWRHRAYPMDVIRLPDLPPAQRQSDMGSGSLALVPQLPARRDYVHLGNRACLVVTPES
ncbi:hypothetical protein LCGC14_0017890 [marine sediment metagenome]|uniref:Uncharacterized protein n=1 Tax=marine sediment metagenome TaxID=412755 RepID=A0A0F9Z2I6_9ZZZZ